MNTGTEIDTRQESTTVEGRSDALASFGLAHVAACTSADVAVALAIALLEWLT
jgi:hypothetical protein